MEKTQFIILTSEETKEKITKEYLYEMVKHHKKILLILSKIGIHLKNKCDYKNELEFINLFEKICDKKDNEIYDVKTINKIEKIKINNDDECNKLIEMLIENMRTHNLINKIMDLR